MTSSTILRLFSMSSKTSETRRLQSFPAWVIPNWSRVYWYRPNGVENVVSADDSSSIWTWWCLLQGIDHRKKFHPWRNRLNSLEWRGRVKSWPDDVVVEDCEIHTQTNVTILLRCYHDRMNPCCWSSHLPDNLCSSRWFSSFFNLGKRGSETGRDPRKVTGTAPSFNSKWHAGPTMGRQTPSKMWGKSAVKIFRSSFFLSSVGLITTDAIRCGKNLELKFFTGSSLIA